MSEEGRYIKGHLPFDQQADQLMARGLRADRDELIKRLSSVSYYRLAGYLYSARNLCAHHCRLWNRELGYPPSLPNKNKFPEWHEKTGEGKNVFNNSRCGIILMICRMMLRITASSSRWHERVEELFAACPDIPHADMGLPADWQKHPLWKQ